MARSNSRTAAISAARRSASGALTATLGERLRAAQVAFTWRSPLTGEPLVSGKLIRTPKGVMPEVMPYAEKYIEEMSKIVLYSKRRFGRDPLTHDLICLSEDEAKIFGGPTRAP